MSHLHNTLNTVCLLHCCNDSKRPVATQAAGLELSCRASIHRSVIDYKARHKRKKTSCLSRFNKSVSPCLLFCWPRNSPPIQPAVPLGHQRPLLTAASIMQASNVSAQSDKLQSLSPLAHCARVHARTWMDGAERFRHWVRCSLSREL